MTKRSPFRYFKTTPEINRLAVMVCIGFNSRCQRRSKFRPAWRMQITGAGLGTRLANSIRSQTFPRSGESLDAAALVWSKAPVIVGAHDTGPLIRSRNGFWLGRLMEMPRLNLIHGVVAVVAY
jgi:hypothetical protein